MATKLGSLTLDLICRTGNFTQGMRDASNSASREMDRIQQSTTNVTNALKGMAAAAIGTFSLSQLSGYADGYINLQNRLKLVTSSQKELTQATNDTYRISQVTASSWDSTAQVYQRFAQNAKSLGINLKQAATLTETVTKAIAISGGTAASSEAALVQFGQSLSSGILRGEEYNSISEQAGGLRDAIAKGLNISVGDLRKWANEGKLTTDVVIKALENAKVSVDDLFGKTDFAGAQGWQLIQDAAMKTVGEFSKATGASKAMFESLKALSENMELVSKAALVGAAYIAGSYVPALMSSIAVGYTKIKQLTEQTAMQYAVIQAEKIAAVSALARAEAQVANIQATLTALSTEKALEAQRLKSQITDIGRIASTTRMAQLRQVESQVTAELTLAETALTNARTRSTAAAAASTITSRGLLSVLGGPVGLGITAASVAAGFLLMSNSSKDTQNSLEDQGLTVDELKKKYQEMNAEAVKLKALDAAEVIKKQNIDIRSSFSALQQVIDGFVDTSRIQEAKGLTEYLDDLKAGGDRASKAFSILESKKILTDSQLRTVANLGQQVNDSRASIEKQNTILDIAKNKHLDHAKAAKTGAEGVGKVGIEAVSAAAKVKNLGEEVQKFINDSLNSTTDNLRKYQLISQGYTTATAEMILAAEKAEGVNGTGGPLSVLSSSVLATQILSQKKLTDLVDERTEAEKKVNDELKKRKELLEKTVNSKTIDSVIARGEGNYNSFNKGKAGDSVGSKLNLVDMTVGQIRALQKNGSIFAAGKYQAIPKTLQGAIDAGIVSTAEKFNAEVQERIVQQYLLTAKKDRGSIEDYIKSKSDNLYAANLDLAKEFASVASPVSGKSYYEGKAGNKASISVKEAQNALKASRELYTQAIASGKSAEEAWKAAFSGSISFVEGSDAQKGLEQLATYKEKLAEDRTALIEHYSLWQKLENDNAKQVKDIQEKFANDPVVRDRLLALQSKAYQEDVENYIKAGDDRVKADYQATQEIIAARQAAFDNINNPIYSMRDKGVEAQAQASMNPVQYQSWQLNKEQQDGYASLGNDLIDSVNAINESQILSEQEKYDQLKSAHEDYINSKASLDLLYDKQTKDLARSQQEEQINMWGGILSTAQNTFSQLAQSAKDGAGEQSSVYRTMFAMQQAFSIASSMVAAYTAYSTAFADPSAMTLTQKFAGGAAVMAALMPAITSISSISLKGMAHNGIDNIPSEGTWLLDGGERVLNPQQNKDLTNYLANSKSQGPSIVINNNAQTNVSARQGLDGKMYVTIDEVEDWFSRSMQNPNSRPSKSMQQNTTARPRRK